MNHDQDDDDFIVINGRRVLKDGRKIRVPAQFMDSRPGWRIDDDDDAQDDVRDAHAEYVQWLSGAHRAPVADADYDEPPSRPASLRDARAAADAAYEERSEWLRNAHKERRP